MKFEQFSLGNNLLYKELIHNKFTFFFIRFDLTRDELFIFRVLMKVNINVVFIFILSF